MRQRHDTDAWAALLLRAGLGDPIVQALTLVDASNGTARPGRLPASLPSVVVAVDREGAPRADWAACADVLLSCTPDAPPPWIPLERADCDRVLQALDHTCSRTPLAAITLVQLLRTAEAQSFSTAMVLESLSYSMLLAGPEFRKWRMEHPPRALDARNDGCVELDRELDLLRITLNRPARCNALSVLIREQLMQALQLARADPSIEAVLLSGVGAHFCAGGDLDEFGTSPDPATAHQLRLRQSAALAMEPIRHKIEARVQGACIGGGIEIAACAAHLVGAPLSRFSLPEVGMGLIPGAGGTASIARRIGRHRTAYLALTGEAIGAGTALAWGLIDAIEH